MPWDDIILHDVGGVTEFVVHEPSDCTAKCGVGELRITNNPRVPYVRGVVSIVGEGIKHKHSDDPQLVGTWLAAFGGYARVVGETEGGWIHYLPDDPEFDFKPGDWPHGPQKVLTREEGLKEIAARKVFHPGMPV